eukprot:CAMPEP_0172471326 /NCGR_PEP_ID=MMETSP1065-20121228/67760_1 /TAXON_ID=265537 /ORGANISM="Amphiprora paludosa, Strain CCMP125" /LENGTH=361 /DNA_ID=CAMNT_0013229421 /DNA_START=963 /DNA_END=2048 /DNA_ORIENTATION=-
MPSNDEYDPPENPYLVGDEDEDGDELIVSIMPSNDEYDPPENPYLVGDEDEDGDENDEEDLGDDDGDDDLDSDNPMIHLPEYVVKRVEKIKELSSARDAIMEQYLTERAELEKRFAGLVKPIYNERHLVVCGEKDQDIAQETGSRPDPDVDEVLKGIPHFWVTCISNHETAGEIVTEQDVDCLESLQDVICEDDPDGKGFTLSFVFGPNDYFHDKVLTKRYEVPNLLLSDEPLIKSVEGSAIQWKDEEEHCLTHRQIQKKQRGKGKKAGQVRTVTKTEKKESFFHWFDAPKMPNNSQVENMDEEEVEQIEELFSDDFEIAQAFRSELIPNAVVWYTGEASEQLMMELMGDVDGETETANEE